MLFTFNSHFLTRDLRSKTFLKRRIFRWFPRLRTLETSAACAIVGFPSMHANNSMDRDLLYLWFHDYSKVEMWYSKKIGSLPERVSAPDRFVFFLYSTTMRSPFKKRKPFRRNFMSAPDGLLRMQIRYFKRRQPRESRRVNNRNHDFDYDVS